MTCINTSVRNPIIDEDIVLGPGDKDIVSLLQIKASRVAIVTGRLLRRHHEVM
jgi:hypothetical protein